MSTRVGIILQARCASTRLPGKALARIAGRPLLDRCLRRLNAARVGPVVLATTESIEDLVLTDLARLAGVASFRGATDDVLRRYVEAAGVFGFDVIVRATGDNPAVDIDAASRLLPAVLEQGADYACEDGLPYGAGVEVVTRAALTRAASLACTADDREHVTLFIKHRPDLFHVTHQLAPSTLQRPDLRLTVDTPADLAYIRRVVTYCGAGERPLDEIIRAADRCRRRSAA
jgi:spore coat polysaccharide biosynthesis protein SpsF